MSLNFGRELLAIPGPSVMPDRVLQAMHRASPNIYEGELVELTYKMLPDLKAVARTRGKVAIYIANGHGAWDAAVRNVLSPGDTVLVLETGRFGTNWGKLTESNGIEVEWLDFGLQSDADPNRVEERLRKDTEGEIKAVLTVQTDTSTSVRNDIRALRAAIDASGHDALFMVDCVASLACEPYEMDDWGVDVTVAACQKGLMTPAGMAFVYFGEKAAKAREGTNPGEYWDWKPRADPQLYYELFGGTAPTHHLYGLREALTILLHEEGLENAWARHGIIAEAYWAALDAWGLNGEIRPNIVDRDKRSFAVTTVETGKNDAVRIRSWCEKNAGVTLGIGLGFGAPGSPEFSRRFRIGHMGHNNIAMVMGVIGSIDASLKSLDIDHGEGAIESASSVFAAHVSPMQDEPTMNEATSSQGCCG